MVTELIDTAVNCLEKPCSPLGNFMEWFWETKFTDNKAPDRSLPNIGCSLVFNLGGSYSLSSSIGSFKVNNDIVWPRNKTWIDYSRNEHVFGIKFGFSLLPFISKKPQYYFNDRLETLRSNIDPELCKRIHRTSCFQERIRICENYFQDIYEKNTKQINKHKVVIEMVEEWQAGNFLDFNISQLVKKNFTCSKTLERYFLNFLGVTPKQALCILRSRQSLKEYFTLKDKFDIYSYGYYDHSHFYREILNVTGIKIGDLKSERLQRTVH
jgi:hypothetical protein